MTSSFANDPPQNQDVINYQVRNQTTTTGPRTDPLSGSSLSLSAMPCTAETAQRKRARRWKSHPTSPWRLRPRLIQHFSTMQDDGELLAIKSLIRQIILWIPTLLNTLIGLNMLRNLLVFDRLRIQKVQAIFQAKRTVLNSIATHRGQKSDGRAMDVKKTFDRRGRLKINTKSTRCLPLLSALSTDKLKLTQPSLEFDNNEQVLDVVNEAETIGLVGWGYRHWVRSCIRRVFVFSSANKPYLRLLPIRPWG
ncbi:hypothetical protein PM082_004586 [Marasmius tenuissimus]|nr:hypothetical protein PM082_004586 [Marasmius tenuissimus]